MVVEQEAKPQRVAHGGLMSESHLNPGVWCSDHRKARRAWPRGAGHGFLVEVTVADLGFLTCKMGC